MLSNKNYDMFSNNILNFGVIGALKRNQRITDHR